MLFCSPTGAGKSICFEIALFFFEAICFEVDIAETQSTASSVYLVVAPLVSLMKDQDSSLRNRGIAAAMIDPESSAAEINLVFGSPKTLLNSHKTVFRELI